MTQFSDTALKLAQRYLFKAGATGRSDLRKAARLVARAGERLGFQPLTETGVPDTPPNIGLATASLVRALSLIMGALPTGELSDGQLLTLKKALNKAQVCFWWEPFTDPEDLRGDEAGLAVQQAAGDAGTAQIIVADGCCGFCGRPSARNNPVAQGESCSVCWRCTRVIAARLLPPSEGKTC